MIKFEHVTFRYPRNRGLGLTRFVTYLSPITLFAQFRRTAKKNPHKPRSNENQPALNDVTLDIPDGQFLGLLGHNGAGKTTALRLILGLLRPQTGHIEVGGFAPGNPSAPRTLVSYMPELHGIYDRLTGFQNLEFRARAALVDPAQIRPRSEDLLKKLGLLERGSEKAGYWSKGMKQRLSLSCALISQPKLLLLDEPTNGLDPESLAIMLEILKQANAEGTTIIMSSHDLNSVRQVCTHIAIIQNGRIIHTGALDGSIESLEKTYLKLTVGEKMP